MTPSLPRLSAVVLAWGDEPVLTECVESVLASTGVDVDVVLVDNGCTSDAVDRLRGRPGVTVLDPGENLGFAPGCNYGARHTDAEHLAFVNGDATVRPDALARLVEVASGDDVGLATASVRLYDDPGTINSVGNPVHYTGMSWAGGLGDPATRHQLARDVASASGATTVVRRDRFEALGGFCEPMFAYCEDTELSLRCWQRGWRVVFVPEAVALHRYEFSRNPVKFYLLERNRLFLLLTVFPARQLVATLPILLGFELGIVGIAARDGWLRQKLSGWWWLLRHASVVRERRRLVRGQVTVPDRDVAARLTGDLTPAGEGLGAPAPARVLARAYWAVAKRAV